MKVTCKLDDCYFLECVTEKEICHISLDAPCEVTIFPISGGKPKTEKFDSPTAALEHIENWTGKDTD